MASRPGVARGLAWGDIRLVEFGRPDKTRPVLVLTRTSAIPYLSTVTVAPITRTVREVPSELKLGTEHGLKTESAANLHLLQSIDKARVGRLLGSVGDAQRSTIREAVLFALGLDG